jgi:DeoR/GlpR family transcriptional regulator of sugar metabolism
VLIADSSKFGRLSLAVVAPLSAFDVLVTDSGVADETAAELTRAGVQVVRA